MCCTDAAVMQRPPSSAGEMPRRTDARIWFVIAEEGTAGFAAPPAIELKGDRNTQLHCRCGFAIPVPVNDGGSTPNRAVFAMYWYA